MALRYEVTRLLNRMPNGTIRELVRGWLHEMEESSGALTHALFSGIHRMPAPLKWPGMALLAMSSPPGGAIAGTTAGGTSMLEWLIECLAAHAIRNGTLTTEQRRRVLQFLRYKHRHLPKSCR